MTTNTPTYALPYPDPADPVANGDDTIKALAQRLELVLSAGDLADTFLAAGQTIAGGATASLGSIAIAQTYRRRTLHVAIHATPASATAVLVNLIPNYADARIQNTGRVFRQSFAASGLDQVMYFALPLYVGAAGTTQFDLSVGGAVSLTNVRARVFIA